MKFRFLAFLYAAMAFLGPSPVYGDDQVQCHFSLRSLEAQTPLRYVGLDSTIHKANFSENADLRSMNTKGFSVVATRNIWTTEEAQTVRSILQTETKQLNRDDLYLSTIDRVRNKFPHEISNKLLSYLKWVHETLNSELGPTEGALYIEHVLIRQYSRSDLVNGLHVHGSQTDSSYIGINKSEAGLNTTVSEDEGLTRYATPEGSSLFFSEMGRSMALQGAIPATLHGSPEEDPQRILILINIKSERRDQWLVEQVQDVYRKFTLMKPNIQEITVPDLLQLFQQTPEGSNRSKIVGKIISEYLELRAETLRTQILKDQSDPNKWPIHYVNLLKLAGLASLHAPHLEDQVRHLVRLTMH